MSSGPYWRDKFPPNYWQLSRDESLTNMVPSTCRRDHINQKNSTQLVSVKLFFVIFLFLPTTFCRRDHLVARSPYSCSQGKIVTKDEIQKVNVNKIRNSKDLVYNRKN